MTDAIKSFFGKYHAVPAGDGGPDWKAASTDALLGWFAGDAPLAPASPAVRARLEQVANELLSRVAATWPRLSALPAGSPEHNEVGRILAALGGNARLFRLTAKE